MTPVVIKTPAEIEIMAEGGKKLAAIRDRVVKGIKPGVTTNQIDSLADRLIQKHGGEASFKQVPGYHWATCISVNEEVVHGVPGKRVIHKGDLVSLDLGLLYKGFHTDTSITIAVDSHHHDRFLETGKLALKRAIAQAKVGRRVWDLSQAMQQTVEAAGYSAVRALTGHGIGRHLHEEPALPCFVLGSYRHSPPLIAGLVLAIEVMYNQGIAEVVYKNADGWTITTADGKISGLFEDTVAVTSHGPVVLT